MGRNILRFFLLTTYYLLLTTFLSGCATTGAITKPVSLDPSLSSQIVNIAGLQYIPLENLCQFYRIDWQWDPFSRKITLRKNDRQIVLFVNSKLVLVDNRAEDIRAAVILHRGSVEIPLYLCSLIYDIVKEKPIAVIPTPGQRPFAITTVVLDAGHGGKDPGAIGKHGLREKEVVLDITKRLKTGLEENNIKVLMTRWDDKFIPLYTRTDFANRKDADLFISIHANASKSRWISGFEVHCLSDKIDDSIRALAAAEDEDLDFTESSMNTSSDDLKAILWDMVYTENRKQSIQLGKSICNSVSHYSDTKNRSIKKAPFYVLKKTNMPAILIEVGYISNLDEEEKLGKPSHRQELANAILKGILDYKKEYESTRGFTNLR